MTQTERLLARLKAGDAIDPITALHDLGIYRLGARVFDLKAAGHDIHTELVPVTNRFGDECRVASYTLKGENHHA